MSLNLHLSNYSLEYKKFQLILKTKILAFLIFPKFKRKKLIINLNNIHKSENILYKNKF